MKDPYVHPLAKRIVKDIRDKEIVKQKLRGEKYEAMFREVKGYAFEFPRINERMGLRNIIDDLEQKYFPKRSVVR